jgi:hypothetical protein
VCACAGCVGCPAQAQVSARDAGGTRNGGSLGTRHGLHVGLAAALGGLAAGPDGDAPHAQRPALGGHRVGVRALPAGGEAGREPRRDIGPLEPGVAAEHREHVGQYVPRLPAVLPGRRAR